MRTRLLTLSHIWFSSHKSPLFAPARPIGKSLCETDSLMFYIGHTHNPIYYSSSNPTLLALYSLKLPSILLLSHSFTQPSRPASHPSSSLKLPKLQFPILVSWSSSKPCYVFDLMAPSFVSPAWAVCSSLILMLVAAAPATVQGDCSASNRCGNLTISEPFVFVPEYATEGNCGQMGFEVTCLNNTPYLGYYRQNNESHELQILHIFYGSSSLLVADTGKLRDLANLSHRDCQQYKFPMANTSSKIALPFTISPMNKKLILYSCAEPPPPAEGLAEMRCGNSTFVARVGGSFGELDNSGRYFLEGCDVIVMPMLGETLEADASNIEELISNGFLLTWQLPSAGEKNTGKVVGIVFGAVGGIGIGCFFIFFVWRKHTRRKLHFFLCGKTSSRTETNIEDLIISHGSLAPKRYKYSEVMKITSSLDVKLGEGGYGVVFKGRIDDGRLVAVKFLHDSKREGEEFVNEVMSIGRTSHVNIVSLFGFCLESSKRALIYEYMSNGSLDKYIYSENPKEILGWDKLYRIAIGIARGLEYLHHSCNTRIVHFDIKPQNILLDKDFCPKIADFGLAKLCHTKESKLSMTGARGTIGFIAPEVHSRSFGAVSTKSDVYSYGMMLLEMVGGRKNVNSVAQKSSEKYFPHWIYDHFGRDDGLQACEVSSENEGIAKKMSVIGLWCIQILPMHRPTITKVLEMFERGLDEMDMPPRQNFSQILEDPFYNLNAESMSTSSGTKTLAFSEVLKMKEMSVVNSKIIQRPPTL